MRLWFDPLYNFAMFSVLAKDFILPVLAGVAVILLTGQLTKWSRAKRFAIATIIAILAAGVSYFATSEPHTRASGVIAGTILDEQTDSGLSAAEIRVDNGGQVFYTEDTGKFWIDLGPRAAQQRVRVRIRKDGYITAERTIVPPELNVRVSLAKR